MQDVRLETQIKDCLSALKIEESSQLLLSSLGLISLVVKLENEIKIQFELDEINVDNFSSVEIIKKLIQKKQKAKLA